MPSVPAPVTAPPAGVRSTFYANELTITRNPTPTPFSDPRTLVGSSTDHMVIANWTKAGGWEAPAIVPYGPVPLDPASSVLHYATECFEGMKAYRHKKTGEIRIFRPDLNAKRFNMSAKRISLPTFDDAELIALIKTLVSVEERWIAWEGNTAMSDDDGDDSLYIRPMLIGTTPVLGPTAPRHASLLILTNRLQTFNARPLRLHASSPEEAVRAWPSGFGNAKVGANYGPTMAAQAKAAELGYDQVLWLFDASKRIVTEAGAANFFVVWKTDAGDVELVTAPLSLGTVLEGVTRRSVLDLVAERLPDVKVVEREFGITEVTDAVDSGRMIEAFACGTAYFVAPVGVIGVDGKDVSIPLKVDGKTGEYARTIRNWLEEIMFSRVEHPWGVKVD